MLVREGRVAAAAWVETVAAADPRFRGAFFSGSTLAMPGESVLPPTSDVDVVVVLAGAQAPPKPGKLAHGGALLEVTYLASTELGSADSVATSHYLAPSFSGDHIIADPTGRLGRLRDHIAPRFGHSDAVRARFEDVLARIEAGLLAPDPAAAWHEQIQAWLFPTSLTAVAVGVAGLRLPTVRLRYVTARDVFRGDGLYAALLVLLGCAGVDRQTVQQHLDELSGTFDQAATVASTAFAFSTDITSLARPVAIDGSQALIDRGDHREAVFWIVATLARCQQILTADHSAGRRRAGADRFAAAVGDLLCLSDAAGLVTRQAALRDLLPRLRAWASVIAAERQGR